MLKKLLNILKKLGTVLLGNTIYALAVVMFILPSGLITGGTTGLALVAQNAAGVPVEWFVSVFNGVMFLVGAVFLGKKFAATTLLSTLCYPIILTGLLRLPMLREMTQDRLLSAIYAGVMIGVGIGLVIRAGASTGGMDIPPLILHKKLGVPVSVGLYIFDVAILLAQVFFADKEQVLYGILLVLLYTVVLDKVLLMGQSRTQVKVVSRDYRRINEMIIHELDRGSTLIQAETGYCHAQNPMVLTVIANRELPKLSQLVQEIDPQAFMVINRVNEVKGRGFTMKKEYRKAIDRGEPPVL